MENAENCREMVWEWGLDLKLLFAFLQNEATTPYKNNRGGENQTGLAWGMTQSTVPFAYLLFFLFTVHLSVYSTEKMRHAYSVGMQSLLQWRVSWEL